jgi:hypothetical protein
MCDDSQITDDCRTRFFDEDALSTGQVKCIVGLSYLVE